METQRCGYVHDANGMTDLGAVCCWRPVWGDRQRCLWHANETGKAREEIERHRPEPGERIDGAVLRGTNLSDADWFAGRRLVGANFAGATLSEADFTDADLRGASFRDADLSGAQFLRAHLENADFRNADLLDAVLVDARFYRALFAGALVSHETDFGDVTVYEGNARGEDATATLDENGDAVVWTYRALQREYDANALHKQRDRYYLREFDARRRIAWHRGDYVLALQQEGARWVMRYGTSPWRVLAVQALVIVLCAALYPVTGGIQETSLDQTVAFRVADPSTAPSNWILRVFFKSLYFSVVTFATLGYGDIQPIGFWARMIAGMEALLGVLLMALLVFVLTRSVQ